MGLSMKERIKTLAPVAALTGITFGVTAAAAIELTRFGGGVACLWIANAVLIAVLASRPRQDWPVLAAASGIASFIASSTVGLGPSTAPFLAIALLGEALLGVLLMQKLQLARTSLDSVGRVAGMVLAIGLVAPAVSGLLGAGAVAWETGLSYRDNWINWVAAHGLGNITFVPVVMLVANGGARRWFETATPAKRGEAALLMLLVLGTCLAVFGQARLPLLFVPMMPVIYATFRIGRLGAAASVVLVAIVGGVLTLQGYGPVVLVQAGAVGRAQFFQFYLAVTVLTALPVAAELRRRHALFQQLRDSEARYRVLADNTSDVVLSLRTDGTIRYASPSVAQLRGRSPEDLVGLHAADLVVPEDRAEVISRIRDATQRPGRTVKAELRAQAADSTLRWFEAHLRGVTDERGQPAGAVAAVRDITARKLMEEELSLAASTDPLTGLPNRRAFNAALDRLVVEGRPGCVAIFDLDRFKRVNDRWGHEAGDRVITTFAQVARRAIREGDLAARLGGEEFAVILPGATVDQATLVCERVRCAMRDAWIKVADEQLTCVSASAGLAPLGQGRDRMGVLRAADDALYRAKEAGRDRLYLAA
jgi:diguanylate cyclase (GGDEF)-like protein/PAS domain S-box-containing protein